MKEYIAGAIFGLAIVSVIFAFAYVLYSTPVSNSNCTRLRLTYKPLTNDSLYEWNGDVSICDGSELRVPVNGDMLIVRVVE